MLVDHYCYSAGALAARFYRPRRRGFDSSTFGDCCHRPGLLICFKVDEGLNWSTFG